MLFLAVSSINVPTIIGSIIVFVLFVLAVRASIKNHKNGGCSSCGNKSCSSCSSAKNYEEALNKALNKEKKDTISK